MRQTRIIATLLVVLALGAWAWAESTAWPEISYDELKTAIAKHQVTLIDCNGTNFYTESGHIPGALNYQAHRDNLAQFLPKDKDALLVAYCMDTH